MNLAVPGVQDLAEIGRGGSAVVYRGWEPQFGRWVAVKVFAVDEDARRLERERMAVGRLSDHPGIVPVLGGGLTSDGRPYLVMSLMDGGSLADRVNTAGPLGPAQVVALGTVIAGALQAAHGDGIWHRDIKPANILYDRFGSPRLGDFGIAHVGDSSFRTEAGMLSGTVAYLAPELLDGHPFTAAADVFSLGATLYFALEGHHLYESRAEESYAAFLIRRVSAPPPTRFSPAVPGWLRAVLVAATERRPELRPPSAAALADALTQGRRPVPAGAPPPPAASSLAGTGSPPAGDAGPASASPATQEPRSAPVRDGRRVVASVALAGVVIIALAVGLWLRSPAGHPAAVSGPSGTGTATRGTGVDGPPAPRGSATEPASPAGSPQVAIAQAVAAYRSTSGQADPLAVQLVFYLSSPVGGGLYAQAQLPETRHVTQADDYVYRNGAVGPPQPVAVAGQLTPNHEWHFSDVDWAAVPSIIRRTDIVCRAAMRRAGVDDTPDASGKRAGVSYLVVERQPGLADGKVVVLAYFSGGARWTGGYVIYAGTGRLITDRYCTVGS